MNHGHPLWLLIACLAAGVAGAEPCGPRGGIFAPAEGACLGPSGVPVLPTDDFTDVCHTELTRTYSPQPRGPLPPELELRPTDHETYDRFGWRVALEADLLLAAAPGVDGLVRGVGAVLAYRRADGGWVLEERLHPADADAGWWTRFGTDLALAGDRVAVVSEECGTPHDYYYGCAWLYRRDGDRFREERQWAFPARPNTPVNALSVALDGDTLVFGLWQRLDGAGEPVGEVEVWHRDGAGWSRFQTLRPPDGQENDRFGYDVAVSGDLLAVGAFGRDRGDGFNGLDAGAVYVYEREASGWALDYTFVPAAPIAFRAFAGSAVAVEAGRVLLGAPGFGYPDPRGAAFVLERGPGGWTSHGPIVPPSLGEDARFGGAVDLDGERLIVGAANQQSAEAGSAGAVFLMERSGAGWTTVGYLDADEAVTHDDFGFAVASDAGTVAVGMPDDGDYGFDSGSTFVFEGAPVYGYRTHGDHRVTVTATNPPGQSASDQRGFTIDLRPPRVGFLNYFRKTVWEPPVVEPFSEWFETHDADDALGDVILERVTFDGCPMYDGSEYGDRDGLLTDEMMVLDVPLLCEALERCGLLDLSDPQVRIEAIDCGGNVGTMVERKRMPFHPGLCD